VTQSGVEAPSPRPISPAAERQRRRRERRRRGAVVIQLVVSPTTISDLINFGWLRDSDRANPQAVKSAFIRFARSSLRHA
jgi:hypothetical protein